MNNVTLLAQSTDLGGAFSPERVSYAIEMTILGMVAVFSVLALLWGILSLFKVFMYDIPQNNAKTKVVPSVKEPAKVEPVAAPAPVVNTNDDATVAAIMAAISAYISSDPALAEQYAGGFRVVSFKRASTKASWNKK